MPFMAERVDLVGDNRYLLPNRRPSDKGRVSGSPPRDLPLERRKLPQFTVFFFPLLFWLVLLLYHASLAVAQPAACTNEVFAPLAQGVAALRAGNDTAARAEFEKVIKIDRFNPYALNNLAVLAEKQGRWKEAMSYLLDAETYAAEYRHKTEEVCEGGGLCLAVVPSCQKGQNSSIAAIIHSNINLLRTEIGKAPNKP
jgi:tetratricopeptide (TPR) repeat protein